MLTTIHTHEHGVTQQALTPPDQHPASTAIVCPLSRRPFLRLLVRLHNRLQDIAYAREARLRREVNRRVPRGYKTLGLLNKCCTRQAHQLLANRIKTRRTGKAILPIQTRPSTLCREKKA